MHNNVNYNPNPPAALMSYPFPMQHPALMEQQPYISQPPQHFQPHPQRFYHPRPPMQAPRPEKRKQETLTCDACGIEVNSQQMMEAHIRGQKHIKKMKLKAVAASNDPTSTAGDGDQQGSALTPSTGADNVPRTEPDPVVKPAAPVEKSALQLLNELAKYNKIEAKYDLVKENGPAHCKQFEVQLTVGTEVYKGNGTSIKRAQQVAAEQALAATALRKPEPNQRGAHAGRGMRGGAGPGMYANARHAYPSAPPPPPPQQQQHQQFRPRSHAPAMTSNDTVLETLLINRSAEIGESEQTIAMIQQLVEDIERALKTVSDKIAELSKQNKTSAIPILPEHLKSPEAEQANEDSMEPFRMLKGAMKVSTLAMRVFLKTDFEYSLVLICANKPTVALLNEITQELAMVLNVSSIAAVETDTTGGLLSFDVEAHIADACLTVRSSRLPHHVVRIMLTSPVFRSENFLSYDEVTRQQIFALNPDPVDMLDKDKCLEAAAEIRHSNWFTSCMLNHSSNLAVLRILRDLQHSQTPLASLNLWSLALLVFKSHTQPSTSIAALFRSVFACLSSGALLPAPNGPGIIDPCEKDPVDAASSLTTDQRLSITSYAHHVLRLIAFGKCATLFQLDASQIEQSTTNLSLGNYPINY